ncbi:hypothetical protein G4B88_017333 [Cannabis sativa]|uniref:Uncharacterized protein n=1 Tax=Cannabis sativa TaxID=3483 RepID=A0A7J6EFS3_CANSA|nr:hypothetical protein G4B88_017333 [Cannabis sativa]
MGSSSENDLRSHMMLPKMGMVRGPGGSFLVLDFEMMKKKFSLSSFSPLKNSSFVFYVLYEYNSGIRVRNSKEENSILSSCQDSSTIQTWIYLLQDLILRAFEESIEESEKENSTKKKEIDIMMKQAQP